MEKRHNTKMQHVHKHRRVHMPWPENTMHTDVTITAWAEQFTAFALTKVTTIISNWLNALTKAPLA